VAGLPLCKHPRWNQTVADELFRRTKASGAEVIQKKGGAGFAVGLAIAELVHAIVLDSRRILPVSTVQHGAYGLRDVAISVPTIIGRSGVQGIVENALSQDELQALENSADVLRQTLRSVNLV
ncbi:MAG: lactate dehydrogenase, partial [Thermoguttaceae bacterium]